jgi:hypothetical protein
VLAVCGGARHLKLFSPGVDEAESAVDGEEFRAEAQHGDVDGFATAGTEVILGCGEHLLAEAGALVRGIDSEHSEVTAITAGLCVDGGEDLAGGVFGDEDLAFLHHGGESFVVGAGAFEKGFNGEGRVDEGDDARTVGGGGEADVEDGTGGFHKELAGVFLSD